MDRSCCWRMIECDCLLSDSAVTGENSGTVATSRMSDNVGLASWSIQNFESLVCVASRLRIQLGGFSLHPPHQLRSHPHLCTTPLCANRAWTYFPPRLSLPDHLGHHSEHHPASVGSSRRIYVAPRNFSF